MQRNQIFRERNVNICRVCFQSEHNITNLFSDNDTSLNILNQFFLCFQIVMDSEKDLPDGICQNCIKTLHKVNAFRIMCISIYERYADYCKSVTCKADSQFFGDCTNVDEDETEIKSEKLEKGIVHKCDICQKVLKSTSSLSKHTISMHEKRKHAGTVTGSGSLRRYNCTTCTYSTPHSQTLVNHMRRHNGEKPFSCECGKSFTQRSSLAAHRKIHSTNTYFICFICGKQFKLAFALKNHLNVHNKPQFKCNICQKQIKYKRSLQLHMKRHYNIQNYNCEDCGDTFVSSSELINHKVKHKIKNKVECHVCGYQTCTKKNLILHLKRHIGNKEYQCNICHISFYTHGELHRHGRKHSCEKPYSCPTCSQKFAHSPSLNKHMKTVHGIDYKWGEVKKKQLKDTRHFIKR